MFYYTASNPAQLANFPLADMFILYVFSLMACINNFFVAYFTSAIVSVCHRMGGDMYCYLKLWQKKFPYKFFHFALPSLIVLTFPSTKHFQRYEGSSLHAITLNKCTNTKNWVSPQSCGAMCKLRRTPNIGCETLNTSLPTASMWPMRPSN